jgi:outer membrane protein assembly factor BamB
MKFSRMMQKHLIAAIAVTLCAGTARAEDWYRWRGPDVNGISKETGWQATNWPAEGPKQLWKASVGVGFSSVSVSKGRLYAVGNDGKDTDIIYCFDAANGTNIWKYPYQCPLSPNLYEGGPSATPTVDDDRVYMFSRQGDIICLDAATGRSLWGRNVHAQLHKEIPTWGFAGSPLIEGDLVILNAGLAGVAYHKKTGGVVWHSALGVSGYATPVPFDYGTNRYVAIFASKTIQFMDVTGKPVWSYPFETEWEVNAADPIIFDKKVFVSAGYGHGAALFDISQNWPFIIWENKNFRNHINSSVLWQGYLYGVDDISNSKYALKCVAWKDGKEQWADPTFGKGSLMIADGKIIGLSDKGELRIIEPSPAGCKIISRAQVLGGKCWTTPVLSNGRIYCRNSKGDLVCLDVSGKKS